MEGEYFCGRQAVSDGGVVSMTGGEIIREMRAGQMNSARARGAPAAARAFPVHSLLRGQDLHRNAERQRCRPRAPLRTWRRAF